MSIRHPATRDIHLQAVNKTKDPHQLFPVSLTLGEGFSASWIGSEYPATHNALIQLSNALRQNKDSPAGTASRAILRTISERGILSAQDLHHAGIPVFGSTDYELLKMIGKEGEVLHSAKIYLNGLSTSPGDWNRNTIHQILFDQHYGILQVMMERSNDIQLGLMEMPQTDAQRLLTDRASWTAIFVLDPHQFNERDSATAGQLRGGSDTVVLRGPIPPKAIQAIIVPEHLVQTFQEYFPKNKIIPLHSTFMTLDILRWVEPGRKQFRKVTVSVPDYEMEIIKCASQSKAGSIFLHGVRLVASSDGGTTSISLPPAGPVEPFIGLIADITAILRHELLSPFVGVRNTVENLVYVNRETDRLIPLTRLLASICQIIQEIGRLRMARTDIDLTSKLQAIVGQAEALLTQHFLPDENDLQRIRGWLVLDLHRARSVLKLISQRHAAGNPQLIEVARSLSLIKEGKTEVTVDIEGPSAKVHGDLDHFVTMGANLVANAFYRGNASRVVFTSQIDPLNETVIIDVRDDGCGIAENIAANDRLFEPGVSGGDSTGLGLALCRSVVQAMGGTIRLVNAHGESPLTGAHFQVILPLAQIPVSEPPPASPVKRQVRVAA